MVVVVVGPSRRSWWSLLQSVLVFDPIILLGRGIGRVDEFRDDLQIVSDNQHCTCVLVSITVVCSAEHCDKFAPCESFEPIHDTFVCTDNHAEIILLKELVHSIRAEFNDIACSSRVTDHVG